MNAERLTADVLGLDGFADIAPQAPLGGADGGKDIMCTKGGKSYVAGVFFPTTRKTIGAITAKFKNDLEGSKAHNRDGFVFVTNQKLTEKQVSMLVGLALAAGKECFVLDRERIRVRLDSPEGYGVRTQYLGIPMTPEEQFSFFADENRRVMRAMERSSTELQRLSSKIELVLLGQESVKKTMEVLTKDAVSASKLPVGGILSAEPHVGKLSENITPALIIAMHRLACADLPTRMVGRFRDVAVRVATSAGVGQAEESPPPSVVHNMVAELCKTWNANFGTAAKGKPEEKLQAIAYFHARLLHIHPFIDGNGRAGRAILMQQCIDMFGGADMSLFERGTAYSAALGEAYNGDLDSLVDLLRHVVPAARSRKRK